MNLLLSAALALGASARAAPAFAPLEKVREWPVYDERASGETDLGDLCRMARLPCGVVAPKGARLVAPAVPIAGLTVGALLDRILAAHPGYAAELNEGVLVVRRTLDAIARGDGRMLWGAESDGKACAGFRFESWRAPQAIEKGSVLVSVSGHKSLTPKR
ncbi:MAG: hypothetical protein Q8T11_14255 [Elusimicrobiota bacterium]|nr:hypothetical protein [Elusimicrobiota bacterium]